MAASQSSVPPPPDAGGFAALSDAALEVADDDPATTLPASGTSEVPFVVDKPIDAVRVSDAPAPGWNVTLIVQLPLFGRNVIPGQVDAVTRKSAASPPDAIVTALLVAKTRSAVPAFVMVAVALALLPTAVAAKIGPLAGE